VLVGVRIGQALGAAQPASEVGMDDPQGTEYRRRFHSNPACTEIGGIFTGGVWVLDHRRVIFSGASGTFDEQFHNRLPNILG
jgi:hypothetical protein